MSDQAQAIEAPKPLAGRVAIVSGASSGIGRACALQLANTGARVVVAARRKSLLDELVELVDGLGSQAISVVGDASTTAGVEAVIGAALEEFGSIDILVNNLGGTSGPNFKAAPLLELSEDDFDNCFAFNVKSHWLMSKAAAKEMLNAGRGSIINISSGSGRVGAMIAPNVAFYAAAKAAIVHLTTYMAAEWGPDIRVNCVAPALIETEGVQTGVSDAHRERFIAQCAARRLGLASEIADTVGFLASDSASFVSGTTLDVHGGRALASIESPFLEGS
jgi:NAD(P)-dependent dehydrogenase (short-subunit alcohol dehydrogenase family)